MLLSNNYTHVAFMFDAATPENAAEVRSRLNATGAYVEVEQEASNLLITSEEADVSLLAETLRDALQTMGDIPSPQGFEWAYSADKHRVGDFGGGAVVLRRGPGPASFIDTAAWLEAELSQQ